MLYEFGTWNFFYRTLTGKCDNLLTPASKRSQGTVPLRKQKRFKFAEQRLFSV
jgi:hypothetical protein